MAAQTQSTHGDYDVIVIGTGPGGEGAAMSVAKDGRRVAVVDLQDEVGGTCTHQATIPSKALRHAIQQLADTGKAADARYPDLLRSAESVIREQVKLRSGFYERNRVDRLEGHARFVDAHTIEVATTGGARRRYRAQGFVIATGSRPYRPPDVDFSHPRVLDSDTVLALNDTPRSITIYGAGVIGCEYASIFRGLSIKVNLINTRDKLLSFLDDEIIDALAYHLREQGVLIRHSEEYERVEADERGVRVYLKSAKVIQSDYLLWCQGRTGNSNDMGLETLGITCNRRGSIEINSHYQTAQPHIYAVGDVVGDPSLASAAYDQGRFAALHLLNGESEQKLVEHIPAGIYTIPEISSLGLTERELTQSRVPYEVGHAAFRHLARAQITGRTTGMLKILFHRESLRILGIHCFGNQASEIIHIGQAVMAQSGEANSLMYFINTTFNYPTMAEAYRVAALNGYNRLF
jgi:NAD(P) transhydrogenase